MSENAALFMFWSVIVASIAALAIAFGYFEHLEGMAVMECKAE